MTPEFHQQRYIAIIRKNLAILNHLMHLLTPQEARTWRDGGDGWTVLEVLCHLRDFDTIFGQRVVSMLAGGEPTFVRADHDQMALDNHYNDQDVMAVLADLNASRAALLAEFEGFSADQLAIRGTHPESGAWTVMHSIAQIAYHDTNHIEQMTRIMAEKK